MSVARPCRTPRGSSGSSVPNTGARRNVVVRQTLYARGMADHLPLEEAALLRELRPVAGVRLVEPDDISSPLLFELDEIDVEDELAQEAFDHFLDGL